MNILSDNMQLSFFELSMLMTRDLNENMEGGDVCEAKSCNKVVIKMHNWYYNRDYFERKHKSQTYLSIS